MISNHKQKLKIMSVTLTAGVLYSIVLKERI